MQTKMLIDLSDTIRKGDPAPKGHEARYIRAGLAAEVTASVTPAPTPSAPAKKRVRKAKAKK